MPLQENVKNLFLGDAKATTITLRLKMTVKEIAQDQKVGCLYE